MLELSSWKILVKLDHFPKLPGENVKNYLKPPPSYVGKFLPTRWWLKSFYPAVSVVFRHKFSNFSAFLLYPKSFPHNLRHLDIWQLLSVLEEDHASTRTSQENVCQPWSTAIWNLGRFITPILKGTTTITMVILGWSLEMGHGLGFRPWKWGFPWSLEIPIWKPSFV